MNGGAIGTRVAAAQTRQSPKLLPLSRANRASRARQWRSDGVVYSNHAASTPTIITALGVGPAFRLKGAPTAPPLASEDSQTVHASSHPTDFVSFTCARPSPCISKHMPTSPHTIFSIKPSCLYCTSLISLRAPYPLILKQSFCSDIPHKSELKVHSVHCVATFVCGYPLYGYLHKTYPSCFGANLEFPMHHACVIFDRLYRHFIACIFLPKLSLQ